MLEAVKSFVERKVGINKAELNESTRIEEDVSIAGLDTHTLYNDFFAEFGIANPEEFPVDEYVTSENALRDILKALFSRKGRPELRPRETTIGHLTQVALAKKWFVK